VKNISPHFPCLPASSSISLPPMTSNATLYDAAPSSPAAAAAVDDLLVPGDLTDDLDDDSASAEDVIAPADDSSPTPSVMAHSLTRLHRSMKGKGVLKNLTSELSQDILTRQVLQGLSGSRPAASRSTPSSGLHVDTPGLTASGSSSGKGKLKEKIKVAEAETKRGFRKVNKPRLPAPIKKPMPLASAIARPLSIVLKKTQVPVSFCFILLFINSDHYNLVHKDLESGYYRHLALWR
jgi:hypothetical protein